MISAETEIINLLYRYAELMDAGDLENVAALFSHASVKTSEGLVDGAGPLLALWRKHVRIYPCGTPRTKHVITNPILEIDEAAGTAACRSYYSVLQATSELPLQIIAAGRYHDVFTHDGVRWRFAERDYTLLDLTGNLSQHLLIPVRPRRSRNANRPVRRTSPTCHLQEK